MQIKLAPVNAPWFSGADLLIAADCTAFAYGNFHADFIRGRVALVGCPKLDAVDYAEKLSQIFAGNDIRSITVARMEVPCCGGLESAVRRALEMSGKDIPRLGPRDRHERRAFELRALTARRRRGIIGAGRGASSGPAGGLALWGALIFLSVS